MESILAQLKDSSDEIQTFSENYRLLKKTEIVLKDSATAFRLINQNYEREAETVEKVKCILDFLDKSRYYVGELLERFKVIEKNYQTAVSIQEE
jgi:hypothetical protein